jgi:hypothetical protein
MMKAKLSAAPAAKYQASKRNGSLVALAEVAELYGLIVIVSIRTQCDLSTRPSFVVIVTTVHKLVSFVTLVDRHNQYGGSSKSCVAEVHHDLQDICYPGSNIDTRLFAVAFHTL